jgi:hypothetical protein
MSGPPDTKHYAFRQQLRRFAAQGNVTIKAADLIELLNYIDELEEANYTAWERSQGEDL